MRRVSASDTQARKSSFIPEGRRAVAVKIAARLSGVIQRWLSHQMCGPRYALLNDRIIGRLDIQRDHRARVAAACACAVRNRLERDRRVEIRFALTVTAHAFDGASHMFSPNHPSSPAVLIGSCVPPNPTTLQSGLSCVRFARQLSIHCDCPRERRVFSFC